MFSAHPEHQKFLQILVSLPATCRCTRLHPPGRTRIDNIRLSIRSDSFSPHIQESECAQSVLFSWDCPQLVSCKVHYATGLIPCKVFSNSCTNRDSKYRTWHSTKLLAHHQCSQKSMDISLATVLMRAQALRHLWDPILSLTGLLPESWFPFDIYMWAGRGSKGKS